VIKFIIYFFILVNTGLFYDGYIGKQRMNVKR